MPLYLTAVVLGLLGAALVVLQPYTADWPGTEYAKPARQYIRAALRQDSAALARLSASATAVSWGLDAGRAHGDLLGLWRGRGEAPIVLRFVGSGGGNARVWQAGSTCWRP